MNVSIADIQAKPWVSRVAGMLLNCLTIALLPKTVLEIGTGRGYATMCAAIALQENAKIWTIDIRKEALELCTKESERIGVSDKVECITGKSQEIKWGRPIDILYIDGDHSYDAVLADYEKYSPFVEKEGMIIFHDTISKKGVGQVVNEKIDSKWNCLHINVNPGLAICQRKKVSIP